MSATPVGTRQRLDLHNASIDFAAATAGQCGFTHLPSGGICRLPHRHIGPCQLKHQASQPTRRRRAAVRLRRRAQSHLPARTTQPSVQSPRSRPTHQESK
jgi:hypothetical protein